MLEFLPPRNQREVTIDGYAVPRIEALEINNGVDCNIFLDGRMSITIPAEYASSVIWLLANALAIGEGYSCHGENSVWRPNPHKVKVMQIGTMNDAGGDEHPVGDA